MKKIFAGLSALLLLGCFSQVKAEIGVGYETMVVLPHAFTLYYKDKSTGLGAKFSADFGTSLLSNMVKLYGSIVTLGLANINSVNFYTASITKDLTQEPRSRSYARLGAMFFSASSGSASTTTTIPTLGIGWEWEDGLFGQATSCEIGYPEFLTLGLRHYF
ncbi:MAG: hypothetical protein KKC80_04580 [Candidatus Margulisbacteria bacterium]|nr:hypothetical protein [Candidatus Margulisiibacteriota bacterium]MBU1616189.1 hypothetical protein [Candidatus Margulisiibacteriota bacterium]MBU1866889.1 hypothetical protein [Candidatus Margulisiibacteriota bacterium]